MCNIENQIKNIEDNIAIKEKEIKSIDNEIKQIKYASNLVYEQLINQQDVLLKKKENNILTELKTNKLKKKIIDAEKEINNMDVKMKCIFHELNKKKIQINKNTLTIENICCNINKKYDMYDQRKNAIISILNNFLIKKKENSKELTSLLNKQEYKKNIVKNEINQINDAIVLLHKNIIILDSKILNSLYILQNYLEGLIKSNTVISKKSDQIFDPMTYFKIVNKIIEKQKEEEGEEKHKKNKQDIPYDIYNIIGKKQKINNISSKNNDEPKLAIELNTQEFIEFENFI
ncbi:conserved Plasmodium protein, unknown function [Plasmodium chabaudi chabaudi]|uniref:Uncharacterized protein n=1 Tax=Plasmodium chabaudi chabaudi TaxID=31271 RepID=A0A4V0KD26_PLACU|nr:conserved Plasmodium protein, unknown function [Plasmodium chabaudi chabaudi]VTZ70738.1 conserved Plasmodium protein, unknown function [Plasmodium chabaudi chabaudi]|eukprot:XP_737920.2 conserved Plasmodium protein, unknown function [Plasmodium chabaudi chabaudi]